MSICDPIEYDYARALEEHQARQVPIDPDDIPEGEDDIDWEQRGLPEAEGDEG